MLSRTLIRTTRLDRLPRQEGVDDRAVATAFGARFVDELLSGAWTVLAPTFRRVFGLSVFQVGLLFQVLDWVAFVVEPVAASTIDHSPRRRLIAGGAAFVTASVAIMAAAPSYAVLLLGFAVYGIGSGPLCHTADVVVVESFPGVSERAYSRATILDTIGALLGPALVSATLFLGLSWRWALASCAAVGAMHAVAASRSRYPSPPRTRGEDEGVLRALVTGMRAAAQHAEIRRALLVLVAFDIFEAAFLLEYLWLVEDVGLTEAQVALWAALAQVVDIVALVVLDRWLQEHQARRILRGASVVLIVLPTVWVVVPGIALKIVVAIPLAFVWTLVWPLAKAQSLTVEPSLAGATQALSTLTQLLPFALVVTWVSTGIGLGPAIAVLSAIGASLMVVLLRPR
jgi:MFS family permease